MFNGKQYTLQKFESDPNAGSIIVVAESCIREFRTKEAAQKWVKIQASKERHNLDQCGLTLMTRYWRYG
jgi:hypothetical protein